MKIVEKSLKKPIDKCKEICYHVYSSKGNEKIFIKVVLFMTAKEIMEKLKNAGCAMNVYYDNLFYRTVCQIRIPFSKEAEIVNLIGCKFTSGTPDLHNYRLLADGIEFSVHAC